MVSEITAAAEQAGVFRLEEARLVGEVHDPRHAALVDGCRAVADGQVGGGEGRLHAPVVGASLLRTHLLAVGTDACGAAVDGVGLLVREQPIEHVHRGRNDLPIREERLEAHGSGPRQRLWRLLLRVRSLGSAGHSFL